MCCENTRQPHSASSRDRPASAKRCATSFGSSSGLLARITASRNRQMSRWFSAFSYKLESEWPHFLKSLSEYPPPDRRHFSTSSHARPAFCMTGPANIMWSVSSRVAYRLFAAFQYDAAHRARPLNSPLSVLSSGQSLFKAAISTKGSLKVTETSADILLRSSMGCMLRICLRLMGGKPVFYFYQEARCISESHLGSPKSLTSVTASDVPQVDAAIGVGSPF